MSLRKRVKTSKHNPRPAGWYDDDEWNPWVPCACGCGQKRRQSDRHNRPFTFVWGYNNQYRWPRRQEQRAA